ncbi:MAG: hypothetical protein IKA41_08695 [Bacteroidaceae bacterium]|nr:hypothetical protein [Bacteroidaceae bacterium]
MDLKTIASLALLTLSFFSVLFFNWYKVDMFGGFGPFAGLKVSLFGYTQKLSLGDISGFLVIAQTLTVINIFVFLATVAVNLINFDILPPAIKNMAILKRAKRLSLAVYYLVLLVALLFGLIGIIAEDISFGAGWWITLFMSVPGMVLIIRPDITDKLSEIVKGGKPVNQD